MDLPLSRRGFRSHRISWPLVAALALACATVFGQTNPESKVPKPPAAPAPAPSNKEAQGLILPYEEVRLASSGDGVLLQVLVEEGQPVKKDQLIAQLSDSEQRLEVQVAELLEKKAQSDLKAIRKLYDSNIVSKDDLEKAYIESEAAHASATLSKMRLASKGLRSPIDGLLIRRHKNRGEAVQRLEPYAEIVNIDKVWIVAYFEAGLIQRVRTGQPAQVTIPLTRDEPFAGTVEIVDPVIDPGSNLFRVKILVDNPDHAIKTGVNATVRLTTD